MVGVRCRHRRFSRRWQNVTIGSCRRSLLLFSAAGCYRFGIAAGKAGLAQPLPQAGRGWEGGGGRGADALCGQVPGHVTGEGVLLLLVEGAGQRQLAHTLTLAPQRYLLHKQTECLRQHILNFIKKRHWILVEVDIGIPL